MKLYKRNVNINNWNLATIKDLTITDNMLESTKCLTGSVDERIAFFIIGEQSYIAIDFNRRDNIDELVDTFTNAVLSYPPDFNTMILSDGEKGALLYMQGLCWHIVRPSELIFSFGNIDFNCAINAREKLMQACANKEVLGVLLPPNQPLGLEKSYDTKELSQRLIF